MRRAFAMKMTINYTTYKNKTGAIKIIFCHILCQTVHNHNVLFDGKGSSPNGLCPGHLNEVSSGCT